MTYQEIKDELTKGGILSATHFYDYTQDDLELIFEQFFDFCQVNLDEEADFDISPARLIFYPDYSINGKAGPRANYKIIMVYIGSIINLYNFFTGKQHLFDKEEFLQYLELNENLNEDLSFLMYQISNQFLFYHEKTHLIQIVPDTQPFIEKYQTVPNTDQYSEYHHVHEFDADIEAGYFCTLHLIDYWKRLPAELQTSSSMECLLEVGISAIFTYWLFLAGKYSDIYYKAGTHPHPFVRVVYILDVMSKTAMSNLPENIVLNETKIVRAAIHLTDELFKLDHDHRVENFAAIFEKESDNIEKFVNELIKLCDGYPNLVRNRRQ